MPQQSIRRVAARKITKAQRELGLRTRKRSKLGRLWEICSLPYVLPLLAPLLAIAISLLEPALGSQWRIAAPFPVFSKAESSRELLGLLWQVEGSILALVTAVVLFAFEGLTRSRPGVPIWEYAGRSGLAQYLMLGGAGLSAIPVSLFWPKEVPPLAAAHFAATVSVLGIVALPFFVYNAMRLIDANWLRSQRLADVHLTVAQLVREEAIERVALNELHERVKDLKVEIRNVLPREGGRVCQEAASTATLYDINVRRLIMIAKQSRSTLTIRAAIGDVVAQGTPLLVSEGSAESVQFQPIFILSRGGRVDRMGKLLSQVKEEGFESLRSESSSAIAAVVDSYTELWLAWPRAWAAYGQRLAGGFINQGKLFRLTPLDELRSDLWSLLDTAIERGLREQANALIGIIYRVGSEAIELDAPDILGGITGLARSQLRPTGGAASPFFEVTNDRLVRMQVELCRYHAVPRLEDNRRSVPERRQAAECVSVLFEAIAECLKIALDNRDAALFDGFDKEFCRLLDFWEIEPDEYLSKQALEDRLFAEKASISEDEARDSLELHLIQRELMDLRSMLRLSLLGWALHNVTNKALDEGTLKSLLRVARTFTELEDLVRIVDAALQLRRGRLDDWVMSSLPSNEVHAIDGEGPLFLAVALVLFISPRATIIPPAPWLFEQRVQRLKSAMMVLAEDGELLAAAGIDRQKSADLVIRLSAALDQSLAAQAAIERAELIDQPLDLAKVEEFKAKVLEGWTTARVLPEFLEVGGVALSRRPIECWADRRFGFGPRFENKLLFVTPSKMIGLDHHAREYGRHLARAEFNAVISKIQTASPRLRGKGKVRDRVSQAIEQISAEGYSASVMIVPRDHKLLIALGLAPEWRRRLRTNGFKRSVAGEFLGLTVIEAHKFEANRICVLDFAAFLRVYEMVEAEGPDVVCRVEAIDEVKAAEILAGWKKRKQYDPQRHMSEEDLRANVGVNIYRHFEVEVVAPRASRLVWIPPSLVAKANSSAAAE
ncbi:hypothetical protein AB0F93_09380 [Micromonospora tulbaghiae]|uniref:hypothetical protein n=1 Tax=Micromonospora tulbaghiae TaxID=479978 RepID=UPI00333180CF